MAVYRDYDQAALDAQYNNRAMVPDHADYFARWAKESAAVRERGGILDLAYGDHPRMVLDLFPAPKTDAPLLVFIHGGYWKAFDKTSYSFVAPGFNESGIAVAVISYPLAPAAKMDEITAAARAACAFLWREATAHGYDRDRLFVAGHSAGGHLTAEMASTDWAAEDGDLPADLVKGGIPISGLYDLEPIRLCFQNAEIGLDPDMAAACSPIARVPEGAPPLYLAVGGAESDEFLRQQAEFAAAWRAAGNRAIEHVAPARHHFSVLEDFTGDAPLHHSAVKWLAEDRAPAA